jgi:hypothetical protein
MHDMRIFFENTLDNLEDKNSCPMLSLHYSLNMLLLNHDLSLFWNYTRILDNSKRQYDVRLQNYTNMVVGKIEIQTLEVVVVVLNAKAEMLFILAYQTPFQNQRFQMWVASP